MSETRERDDISGTETTGHSWDGIKELNTPLPRWWLWIFYATIVFSLGYVIAYPAIPLINSATTGVLGWSSRAELTQEVDEARAAQKTFLDQIEQIDVTDIQSDPTLTQFAVAGGSSAYKVYCVQCHGSGAAGGPGYPNLNDDDWIWGGSVEDIYITLLHGIRWEVNDETRISEMPAFGRDGLLSREEIADVSHYVLSMSGQEADAEAALRGIALYDEQCAACHGVDGEGVRDLGGPRLSDAIWLYGGSYGEVVAQISNPQQGVLPSWGERLGDLTVKQLAVYIHSLGGGE